MCWKGLVFERRTERMAWRCPSPGPRTSRNHLEFFGAAIRKDLLLHLADLGRLRVRKDPAFQLDERRMAGLKFFHHILGGDLRAQRVPTSKDIHRGIAVLRPGVDREMRLRDDDDAADAEGAELMEVGTDDRGFGDHRYPLPSVH